MGQKKQFQDKIYQLVEVFDRNIDQYKTQSDSNFNEAQLREQFLNPMFKALGWDMYNEQGFAEQYKEVVHEDKVVIKGKPKAPDYSFRIGGQRKFFLEAKKPVIKIKTDYDPALQLRRYAWSGHLPVSLLSDFEEFAIYDTTIEPKPTDKASVARIEYFTYDQYPDNWEKIYDTFAKESILKGSFDRYADKEKRGKQVVDKAFLEEIEKWRELLAKDLAKNNQKLTVEELNFAVQRIIDRLIFLRIAEDRGIEQYKNLQNLIKSKNSYRELNKYFKVAQKKYNSNLFDFDSDTLTPSLKVSDDILDKILNQLYYPTSPYVFDVIGVEVLGNIYEQFLGKVIRLTRAHNAKVEEKPEVKKAGGVYYTPKYIVDYIVKNTVGELLKRKDPKKVSKLKILDPACGSGSFLLGAYEYLLDWHISYYEKQDDKEKKKLEKKGVIYSKVSEDGVTSWFLTTQEKKRIMLNNIYGVDIDSQAVEVTKLSLALKMLENENQETIAQQMSLFQERILPDLSSNIKCGNSLVGSDYWDDKDLSGVSEEEIREVNAFDWDKEFKGVLGDEPLNIYVDQNLNLKRVNELYRKGKVVFSQAQREEQQFKNTRKVGQAFSLDVSKLDGKDMLVGAELKILLKILPKSDAEHLYSAYLNKVPYFVTNDKGDYIVDGKKEKLEKILHHQIEIITEAQLNCLVEKVDIGGFDAVIGNPPYLRLQGLQEYLPETLSYIKEKYHSAQSGNIDIYIIFLEKALQIISKNGITGFILPHKFFNADMGKNIREIITTKKALKKVISFKENQVFENATTYTCLLFMSGKPNTNLTYAEQNENESPEKFLNNLDEIEKIEHPTKGKKVWRFFESEVQKVMDKLFSCPKTLQDYTEKIFCGLQTSADKIYVLTDIKEIKGFYEGYSKQLDKRVKIEKGLCKLFLKGQDVHRYEYLKPDKVVIFPYLIDNEDADLMSLDYIKKNFPQGYGYLLENKKDLEDRENGRMRHENFYAYIYPKSLIEFQHRRIITPEISNNCNLTVKENDITFTTKVYGFKFYQKYNFDDLFFIAILNSPVLWFFLSQTGYVLRGGYYTFKTSYLNPFPMPDLDINNKQFKKTHDELVDFVHTQLELNKSLKDISSDSKRDVIRKKISDTDQRVNELVYKLYGLTKEEIKIIEQKI
ncbi:N-6 DNA methylase [Candidatus Dojkabacteria bacterium]|nr:N-6 DNA methylase [Candidatus Dojkabacteria bacterium]